MWTGFYPVKDFSNFSLHKKKAKCKDAFCFFYCFCEKWNDPTDAWNNMKNLSVYLKSAMVTSWKIKSIGAKERWGHRKEKKKKNSGKGLSRKGDQRAWEVGGCLQLLLPLYKDFQMCSCNSCGLHQCLLHQSCTGAKFVPLLLFNESF